MAMERNMVEYNVHMDSIQYFCGSDVQIVRRAVGCIRCSKLIIFHHGDKTSFGDECMSVVLEGFLWSSCNFFWNEIVLFYMFQEGT